MADASYVYVGVGDGVVGGVAGRCYAWTGVATDAE